MGRYMKRGEMVQRDVINLCVVLQQLPDTVHVIALSCHVDGGQTVLRTESGVETGDMHIHIYTPLFLSLRDSEINPIYLGLGLDWGAVLQQDLDDANVTVAGGTVERGQLILRGVGGSQACSSHDINTMV